MHVELRDVGLVATLVKPPSLVYLYTDGGQFGEDDLDVFGVDGSVGYRGVVVGGCRCGCGWSVGFVTVPGVMEGVVCADLEGFVKYRF